MKIFYALLLFATTNFYLNAQEAVRSVDFKLLDNILINDSIYSVYAKSETEKFILKFKNINDSINTQEYIKSVNPDLLVADVLKVIKNNLDENLEITQVSSSEKKPIINLLEKLKASDLATLKASKTELENRLYDVENEKDQYSAKISLNKEIPYHKESNKKSLKQAKKNINVSTPKDTNFAEILEIIDAKIQFFNNKASSIYIKAELIRDSINKETLIFVNNKHSVPLRYFNNYGNTVCVESKTGENIKIDYNDVFDYESDQFFNYSIANSQVSLSNVEPNKSTSKVIQRRFFDFFTGIVYSDIMGFNTENSNSILNAQAKLLLPLNLKNKNELTLTRQFSTTANIALNSSFEDESRFIAIKDDETFNNFDLLRKNNLYGKINLDILTYESKGWFLNTSLGYSAAFYRTGFRYTQTINNAEDIVTSKQLISVGHGPYLNFEIRPQTNFGADIYIALEDLNYNDITTINNRSFNNNIITDNGHNHFATKYNLANIEANFYWLTNPEKSKGGIYAKLGAYYHTESYNVFPQLMVGYATNLTSFVNRFKAKNTEETIQ